MARIECQPSQELAILRQHPDVEVVNEHDDPLVLVGVTHSYVV
jgi:hypothetical protein